MSNENEPDFSRYRALVLCCCVVALLCCIVIIVAKVMAT